MTDIPSKISKAAAGYGPSESVRVRCGTCTMFKPPFGCTLVLGLISTDAVCSFWDGKESPDAHTA